MTDAASLLRMNGISDYYTTLCFFMGEHSTAR